MSVFDGLKTCSSSFNSFCVTKSIEFSMSFLLFTATFCQLCSRIKRQRQISFSVVVSILMQFSLICNMFFCWFHKSYYLYDIEVFTFSLYFITIVYQVALRLVKKSIQLKKIHWVIINGIFFIYIVAIITILIFRLTDIYSTQLCNQIWVLIMQGLGIILSICMVIGGLKHEELEKSKFSGFYKDQHLKNPMPSMWKWIMINIFCQILGLSESLYLQLSPYQKCKFSSNTIIESILNLFFDIFSYHLGMLSTFWFLKKKYEQQKVIKRNSLRKDSIGEQTNNIQMIIARYSQMY